MKAEVLFKGGKKNSSSKCSKVELNSILSIILFIFIINLPFLAQNTYQYNILFISLWLLLTI